ncbi:MAG: ABC transporter ATP-binding protein, partial [Desulfovibrionaceae bacterium]
LARAMVHAPEALLLDEPLSGLDQEARARFREEVERAMSRGAQVFWATHDPGEVPAGVDRTLRLEAGRAREA